jgi:UDP-glucose:(heptosyl)LPS alpha-1,3-glucosyltransferase
MNIAFCYESVIPERGGCETYIADLARRMASDGHEIHLYACRWDEQALPKGIIYHPLPPCRGIRFLRPWEFSRRCKKALAENRHDLSVGFNKSWGQDVVYPLGGLHAASADYNTRKYASPLARRLTRLLKHINPIHWSYALLERKQYLSESPAIIANSEMVRRHFHYYYRFPEEKIFVVHNSIDPDRFPQEQRLTVRQQKRQEWNLQPADVVATFVARNYKLKGLTPLLKSVKALVERQDVVNRGSFRLIVAGDAETAPYQQLAGSLGIADQVRFLGSCPDISHAFFAADFLVHPTFYDPCSLVVLEALACGLPVITSRYNGAAEFLHPPRDGFIIQDPHDAEELAGCLAELLNHEKRGDCARAARQAGCQWTFEHHYQRLLEVFGQVMRQKQAA